MAIFYPNYETIIQNKIKLEPGERHLLDYIKNNLNDTYEVFFNPMLNGDRPDFVLVRKGFGVLIVEVKDFNLDSYHLDDRKNWVVKSAKAKIKSPISQVLKYKENLFNLHIPQLLEMKINNFRIFNVVQCAIYFHNANAIEIENFLVTPYQHDKKYLDFLHYNVHFVGRDNLNNVDFPLFLSKASIGKNHTSPLFSDELYNSFKRFLSPPLHLKSQGKNIPYTKRQIEIIHSQNREQRIKGVVGSGKTTILAARAVQAYVRHQSPVLILTYNITLKNYIHDKLSDVREDFAWSNFVILNYHNFINQEFNNLGIDIEVPENFNTYTPEAKEQYFESRYYSNKSLFSDNTDKITKYNSIFIDEIQDYKRAWMEIIKEFYLEENGEYVLFGDVKQNIYNNITEGKDVSTNVRGVISLKDCFRSDHRIKDLAIRFQEGFFKEKYEIDDFDVRGKNYKLDLETDLQGYVNYIYLEDTDNVKTLYNIIHENIINKNYVPNDITVLCYSVELLKKFDAYYRYSSHEKTHTMFEPVETVYTLLWNRLNKGQDIPVWLKYLLRLIKREGNYDVLKGFHELSILFTIYDLVANYPGRFEQIFDWYCTKFKTSSSAFVSVINEHKESIQMMHTQINALRKSEQIKNLRNNKKLHFYLNNGTIKLSTIHSFKGWESETIFLIIERNHERLSNTFDEILYTGLTRSKKNLIIINFGNQEYNFKLREIMLALKTEKTL